tara:strand:- start:41 stop:469 length:429 start_codon:yes stop_codon:yes gene_type:complete
MNDSTKNVRAYIYGLLNGNITHDSSGVTVVNKATDQTSYPYIVVQATGMVDDSLKDRFGGVYEVQVQVHTRFPLNFGGQDDCDDISNSILQRIRVRNAISDFGADTMYLFKQTNQRYLEDDDGQYEYFTKTLVFEANVLSDA